MIGNDRIRLPVTAKIALVTAGATGGVPRLLNQLCELGLIYAMTDGADQVSRATLEQVLADGLFVMPPSGPVFAGHRGHLRVAGAAR